MADRSFVVGESVHLRIRVNAPGTRKPADAATVALSSIKRDGAPVTVTPTAFTRQGVGEYTLVIQTAALQPGIYDVSVTVADGPAATVIVPDRFVLKAA